MSNSKRIVITGGNGLIGSSLTTLLQQKGFEVVWLVRSLKPVAVKQYLWNVEDGIVDAEAFINTNIIVHLAGENVGSKRLTSKRKLQILESRLRSTQLLIDTIKKQNLNPELFISASAAGYYGAINSNKIFKENDLPGNDFMATTCVQWEKIVNENLPANIRKVIFRIGIVLSKHSGALPRMIKPIKYYLGAVIGNGNQVFSWIHINDMCNMIYYAIENHQVNGIYNAVGPEITSNRNFTNELARQLNRSIVLPPVPRFMLYLLFGEIAVSLLYGPPISSQKILDTGFKFQYPDLKSTLSDLSS